MISIGLIEDMQQRGYSLTAAPLVVVWVSNGQTQQEQMHYPLTHADDWVKFARQISGAMYIEWVDNAFSGHKVLTKFKS